MTTIQLQARESVNADQISARIQSGVLKVTIPAPAKYKFKKIDVRQAA